MNKSRITNKRNVALASSVLILCAAGMIHTFIGGGWSKSTGEAAKMWPRLVYSVLIIASLILLILELAGRVASEPPALVTVKWWQVLVILAVSIVFFMMVLYVGVATGILAYMLGMICLFDEDFKKNWKWDVVVAVAAGAVLYLIFQYILPIVTMQQILV